MPTASLNCDEREPVPDPVPGGSAVPLPASSRSIQALLYGVRSLGKCPIPDAAPPTAKVALLSRRSPRCNTTQLLVMPAMPARAEI